MRLMELAYRLTSYGVFRIVRKDCRKQKTGINQGGHTFPDNTFAAFPEL